LHYDDAAGSVLAALSADPSVVSGNVFLISDGNPLTRQQICEASLQAAKYHGMSVPKFFASNSDDPIGKIYDGSATNKALKWDPKYPSFAEFMASQK
jgi:nucleoside-diphosphate-sugar epimerase